jgi:hypothetical protein
VENAAILDRPAHSDFEKCFFSSETGMTRNLPALTSRFVNVCNEKSICASLGQIAASDSADQRPSELRRGLAKFDAAGPINNIFGGALDCVNIRNDEARNPASAFGNYCWRIS